MAISPIRDKDNESTLRQRQTYKGHRRTPSIPLRVRSTPLGDASSLLSATLSPSNAELPPAEPFRSPLSPATRSIANTQEINVHAALPQKASEKYGFVVYVGSLVAWYLFLFWSLTPDRYIKAIGIEWYPDRRWALLVPSWIMMSVVYVYIAYFALNLYHTPSLSSMTCITDTQGRLHPHFASGYGMDRSGNEDVPSCSIHRRSLGKEEDYIPPLFDLPVSLVNEAVFG